MTDVKVKKMMRLDANMLGRLKEAEQSLASEKSRELEDSIPDGHPLKVEIDKQKAVLGGDLSGLPPGHPLLRALETAKETYEVRVAEEKKPQTEKPKEDAEKMRKAKRLDEVKARRERWDTERKINDEVNEASSEVNTQMDEVIASVNNMWKVVEKHEEALNQTPVGRVKVLRIKRVLFATKRALSETRIGKA